MAEEQKNRLTEAVETGASTAQAIHGAIKTGKAVSAAAKGAAIGGPYGAAVGAVLAGRRHIGKIIAVIAIVVMLPVLFVLMLPGLLFGGLTGSGASGTEGFPVLNNEQAVIENANNITFSINQLLNEGLDDVLARIDADFAASDGEEMEIHNPYATAPVYNANLFISQYCAARSLDFRTISLSDMEAVLRRNKSYFYSFTRKEELRDREETDPDTNEKSTVTEKWMIYTISYNGEAHFADNVFQLTDEQKELAADYAANLSLFLGDGMLQNLTAWNGNSIPSLGDIRFEDGGTPVVYFNQMDERYADKPYGTDHIGSYGCGPSAMAIVVSSLAGETVDPVEMADWAYKNGYWCKGSGSYHALIPGAAKAWGLPVSGCSASEPQRIIDALSEGKLVVAIMAKGHFTSSGHFIVLRGVQDGKIIDKSQS